MSWTNKFNKYLFVLQKNYLLVTSIKHWKIEIKKLAGVGELFRLPSFPKWMSILLLMWTKNEKKNIFPNLAYENVVI